MKRHLRVVSAGIGLVGSAALILGLAGCRDSSDVDGAAEVGSSEQAANSTPAETETPSAETETPDALEPLAVTNEPEKSADSDEVVMAKACYNLFLANDTDPEYPNTTIDAIDNPDGTVTFTLLPLKDMVANGVRFTPKETCSVTVRPSGQKGVPADLVLPE
ncbi:hypothetical protein ET495_04055 [Xylanimonas allomyrinae]|uniref:Uncharacterized protein n=1 Tax=Xylanimonas allomyrinae TaxID=2509459 RepID=A0A4P6EKC0_9MICO|nr:hypothetical protein [Xylanimonas allomyrinae]QAY62556.1 hypothetical protein ET495_04055 [Xylanimonas allomyrinae]